MQMGSVDERRPGEDAKHAEAPTFHPDGRREVVSLSTWQAFRL